MEGIASHHTFADLSRDTNGRSPIVWQIELIDQVTWCSSATRTRDAQKNAVQTITSLLNGLGFTEVTVR